MMLSREAYLEELARQLRVNARTRNELLTDIENHILDGIAAGESEAEVVVLLGDPRELARSFNRSTQAELPRRAMAAVAVALAVTATAVLQQQPSRIAPPARSPRATSVAVITIDPSDRSVVYVGQPRLSDRAES